MFNRVFITSTLCQKEQNPFRDSFLLFSWSASSSTSLWTEDKELGSTSGSLQTAFSLTDILSGTPIFSLLLVHGSELLFLNTQPTKTSSASHNHSKCKSNPKLSCNPCFFQIKCQVGVKTTTVKISAVYHSGV